MYVWSVRFDGCWDIYHFVMAAVAALCVQYEADFRPNMSIVVKALQPLLTVRPTQHAEHGNE
jgi:hypothetical protein